MKYVLKKESCPVYTVSSRLHKWDPVSRGERGQGGEGGQEGRGEWEGGGEDKGRKSKKNDNSGHMWKGKERLIRDNNSMPRKLGICNNLLNTDTQKHPLPMKKMGYKCWVQIGGKK